MMHLEKHLPYKLLNFCHVALVQTFIAAHPDQGHSDLYPSHCQIHLPKRMHSSCFHPNLKMHVPPLVLEAIINLTSQCYFTDPEKATPIPV